MGPLIDDPPLDDEIKSAMAVDELYYHFELRGEHHIEIPIKNKSAKGLQPVYQDAIDESPICKALQSKLQSPFFEQNYRIHQSYLYRIFRQNTFKSQYELNHNYTLFVHCITNPNGIQIWRKLIVNGRMTLKQVDEALKTVIGYTLSGIGHMTEFRFNLNALKMARKIKDDPQDLESLLLSNELVVFDVDELDQYADGMVYRKLRGSCSPPISEIYFGQIADLYLNQNSKYHRNPKAVPFDPFYHKYYHGLSHGNAPEMKCSDNFSFQRTDCFQYGYDWGEEWRFNIFVVDKVRNSDNAFFSRFVSGKGVHPPNDVGSIEAFKWILEKCHYDPYAFKLEIGDFKVPEDVYQWLITAGISYFEYWCLMGSDGWRVRKWLIQYFKERKGMDNKVRKKIIYRLQSQRPFWFPYRQLQEKEIRDRLSDLNMECAKDWNRKLKRYGKKRKMCAQCGNRKWILKRCKGCLSVMYCSRRCQKLHWKVDHKHECIILKFQNH